MRRFVPCALVALLACNVGPRGFTPLIDASRTGDVAAVRHLIAQGADPNEAAGQNNWTPLLHAIHTHATGSVVALIDGGADVNRLAGDGITPLMMASGYGYTDIVELLLRRGANPRIADPHGATALDLAMTGVPDIDRFTLFDCQNDTVTALLRADPTLRNRAGVPTPAARTWARLKGCGASS